MALDCLGKNQSQGTRVQAWSFIKGNENQMWKFIPLYPIAAHRTYTIKSVHGNVLDSAGIKKDGHEIQQWADVSSTNLQWTLLNADSGYFYLKNVTTGLELNLYGNAGTKRNDGGKLVS